MVFLLYLVSLSFLIGAKFFNLLAVFVIAILAGVILLSVFLARAIERAHVRGDYEW